MNGITPVSETFHGVSVTDPFRWLEDRDSADTAAWIREQQDRWAKYLQDCRCLDTIQLRVHAYLAAATVDQPVKLVGRYLFRRRDKGREQPAIYVRNCDTREERVLLDPSSFGPFASIAIHHVSAHGTLAACELRHGGEDRKSILVLDIESGVQYPDRISNGLIRGFAFAADNAGYYYCREAAPYGADHAIRFHAFGHAGEDPVVFRAPRSPKSRLALMADRVHLGALLVYPEEKGFREDLWITSHASPMEWRRVLFGRKLPFTPFLKSGRILALSFDGAPNGRFIEVSHDGSESREIISEQSWLPEQISFCGKYIFAASAESTIIRSWDLDGNELGKIIAPPETTIRILPNYSHADALFYTLESFTRPASIFEYDPESRTERLWWNGSMPYRSARLAICHSRFAAADGTAVPITIVKQRQARRTHHLPTIMTSYGGFGVPASPRFSVFVSIMIELGFVFALPHIRGGGNGDRTWHEAGRGRSRQTAIDDFCSAAEWLYQNSITTPEKLACFGGSNSGLLVGAAMAHRPELFKAVLCIAPLLDMVGYERLGSTPSWRNEFGTIDDPDDFASLLAYSPYHRISDRTNYPSVLFVSGDRDERCHPAHVRKMAARLLTCPAQQNRVLVDYSAHRGHVPALPLSVREQALAARIAFLCRELDVPVRFGRPL